jgi:hypothetical protein
VPCSQAKKALAMYGHADPRLLPTIKAQCPGWSSAGGAGGAGGAGDNTPPAGGGTKPKPKQKPSSGGANGFAPCGPGTCIGFAGDCEVWNGPGKIPANGYCPDNQPGTLSAMGGAYGGAAATAAPHCAYYFNGNWIKCQCASLQESDYTDPTLVASVNKYCKGCALGPAPPDAANGACLL